MTEDHRAGDYRTRIQDFTDDELIDLAVAEQERQQQHQRDLSAFGGSEAALSVYEAAIARMAAAQDEADRDDWAG